MRVQPTLQHALLEYRLCRNWRDWRPNWISFSTQPIMCLHRNKVTAFLFCPPFCPRFPPIQASHGNARPSALDSLQFKHPMETHSYMYICSQILQSLLETGAHNCTSNYFFYWPCTQFSAAVYNLKWTSPCSVLPMMPLFAARISESCFGDKSVSRL
jgi:hypothetical protein